MSGRSDGIAMIGGGRILAHSRAQEDLPSSQSISVVIPTIGRTSLFAAVDSVLRQSAQVGEIIVAADTTDELLLPHDHRIKIVRTGPGAGGNNARQSGIEAAGLPIIALLDDDDVWAPGKIGAQLEILGTKCPTGAWILACSVVAVWPDGREEHWPFRVISPGEDVAEYLFARHRLRHGHGFIQASGLMFPRELAVQVPFRRQLRFHQDVTWLLDVTSAHPGIPLLQSPDPLVRYAVAPESISSTIRSEQSVQWARDVLSSRSQRAIGDFLMTLPIYYARREGSPRMAFAALRAGWKWGRPGGRAWLYGTGSVVLTCVRSVIATARKRLVEGSA